MRRQLCLAVLLLLAVLAPAQKRAITAKDIFDFHWIGEAQISPTAHKIVFVQATVAPAHDGYETALYLLDDSTPGAAPVPLVSLNSGAMHDSSPRWFSDGTHIAFLRSVVHDGKPTPPQLYLIAATPGASAIRLTDDPP